MKVACLDTHVLIWGIKEEAEPGQEQMIPLAKALLSKLDEEKVPVVVPSIVLAELLMRIPKSEHEPFIGKLQKRFIISPFDAKTASLFGDLWIKKNQIRKEDPECTKNHLKVDLMIVASAVNSGSDRIYSQDDHVIKASVDCIECSGIPLEETQLKFDLRESVNAESTDS
mgnify:CR=1 FL=1